MKTFNEYLEEQSAKVLEEGIADSIRTKWQHLTGVNAQKFANSNGSAPESALEGATKLLKNPHTTDREKQDLARGILQHPKATEEQKIHAIKNAPNANNFNHMKLSNAEKLEIAKHPSADKTTLAGLNRHGGYVFHGDGNDISKNLEATNELHRAIVNHPNVSTRTLDEIANHHIVRKAGGHTYSDDPIHRQEDRGVLRAIKNHPLYHAATADGKSTSYSALKQLKDGQ